MFVCFVLFCFVSFSFILLSFSRFLFSNKREREILWIWAKGEVRWRGVWDGVGGTIIRI